MISKSGIEPVSKSVRFGAWFVFIIGVCAAIGAVTFGLVVDRDPRVLVMLVPMVLLLHVSGSVALTGYAPKYLRFTHGGKSGSDT